VERIKVERYQSQAGAHHYLRALPEFG